MEPQEAKQLVNSSSKSRRNLLNNRGLRSQTTLPKMNIWDFILQRIMPAGRFASRFRRPRAVFDEEKSTQNTPAISIPNTPTTSIQNTPTTSIQNTHATSANHPAANHLPIELFRGIVEHVSSKRDLYALLLSSPTLREEAERVLLKEINMQPNDGDSDLKPFVVQKLERIRRAPQLATSVKKLVFYRSVVKDELLKSVLPLMTNIRDLCFVAAPHAFFNNCSLRLTSFSIMVQTNRQRVALASWMEDQMAEFLMRQRSLTELAVVQPIHSSHVLDTLSPTSLPRLDTLTSHAGIGLLSLLRGRRVRRLNTLHRRQFNTNDMSQEDLKYLQVLVCDRVIGSPFEWPNLEYLQCGCWYHYTTVCQIDGVSMTF